MKAIKKKLIAKLYKKVQDDRWVTREWCEEFIEEVLDKLVT